MSVDGDPDIGSYISEDEREETVDGEGSVRTSRLGMTEPSWMTAPNEDRGYTDVLPRTAESKSRAPTFDSMVDKNGFVIDDERQSLSNGGRGWFSGRKNRRASSVARSTVCRFKDAWSGMLGNTRKKGGLGGASVYGAGAFVNDTPAFPQASRRYA